MMQSRFRRGAFTLIELLVVVAIIALLIAILVPSLRAAQRQARTVVCESNLRQLAQGWLLYVNDWNGFLPGSTNDYTGINRADGEEFDWLGTRNEDGKDTEHVPFDGTIFKYVGKQADLYKCPEDKIDSVAETLGGKLVNKTLYSYTAPLLLAGAPIELFKTTTWPDNFKFNYKWDKQWAKFALSGLPWMIVEEHEGQFLARNTDSAWNNVDTLTDRHNKRAGVAHIDGHVSMRKYQRLTQDITEEAKGIVNAWTVLYHLTDKRIISAGHGGYMGWIRNAPSDIEQ